MVCDSNDDGKDNSNVMKIDNNINNNINRKDGYLYKNNNN